MAKLIHDDTYPNAVRLPFAWIKLLLLGLGIGLLYVAITHTLTVYILEPIYCGKTLDAGACQASLENAGNIADILLFAISALLLVSIRIQNAAIVAFATTISLWGLAGWTKGVPWYISAGASMLLFASSYIAYAWIARTRNSYSVIGISALVVVCIRIIIAL